MQQRRFQKASHERRISVSFSVGTRSVRVQYRDRPCHRWALHRWRLPTQPLKLGCKLRQRAAACVCLLIPPAGIGRIASSLLPNRHCAGTKRGEPAATGSEVQHPKSLRTPQRGEGGRPCFRISSSGTIPQTGRVWCNSHRECGAMNAQKEGAKSSFCA